MQNADHSEGVMGQQHNQTIMITGNQAQPQQPPQTPPIQQVNVRKNTYLIEKWYIHEYCCVPRLRE